MAMMIMLELGLRILRIARGMESRAVEISALKVVLSLCMVRNCVLV